MLLDDLGPYRNLDKEENQAGNKKGGFHDSRTRKGEL